jgi:large subunit ribosomal protein L24
MTTQARKVKTRIRRNDLVMVTTGKDRGKTGKVLRVLPNENRVVIERINMVKRHSRPTGPAAPGGIVEREAPIDLSNVMIMCDQCNAPVRTGIKTAADGSRMRVCRHCKEAFGNQ